ncbi:MAG: GNAT family N-acetyltransferase [Acholeplasmatales bacterium]|jgi:hypothetical protein|nr:GNAT family N-acetyltransferase [Acholeplasmatales bacterium]
MLYLEEEIKNLVYKYNPSGHLEIFKENKIEFKTSFGYLNESLNLKIKDDSLFSFSFMSKIFIIISLYQLVEKGLLDLETPLNKLIPELNNTYSFSVSKVISGKSKIKDLQDDINRKYQNEKFYLELNDLEKILYDFKQSTLSIEFPDVISYLNNNSLGDLNLSNNSKTILLLLKKVVEVVSSMKLEEYIINNIFLPNDINIRSGYNTRLLSYSNFIDGNNKALEFIGDISEYFMISFDELSKFFSSLFNYKLLKKETCKLLLPKNDEYYGILFYYDNGFINADINSLKGTCSSGMDNKSLDLLVVLTRNSFGKKIPGPTSDESFYSGLIDVLFTNYFKYNNPKLKKMEFKYLNSACKIDVFEEQYRYVASGAFTIAYCSFSKKNHIYVLVDNDCVVGLVSLFWDKTLKIYQLNSIIIDKKFQNKGYGKYIANEGSKILFKKGAHLVEIGVNRNNLIAIKTYLSSGFIISSSDSSHYTLVRYKNDLLN